MYDLNKWLFISPTYILNYKSIGSGHLVAANIFTALVIVICMGQKGCVSMCAACALQYWRVKGRKGTLSQSQACLNSPSCVF